MRNSGTTPVGLFLNGASPYGILDMSGNVLEWTRNIWNDKFKYPYLSNDGREDLQSKDARLLRGGSFVNPFDFASCACRLMKHPDFRDWNFGFRVAVSPIYSL